MRGIRSVVTSALLLAVQVPGVGAQDSNILLPVDSIERRLTRDSMEVVDRRASRGMPDERTSRTALAFPDGTMLLVKWARAAPGGEAFNNSPRFELAAYELQKLFLEEPEYVVPPTVARVFPLSRYGELDPEDPDGRPTFRDTRSALVILQYWLYNVSPDAFWDRGRFQADSVYARHFANFNILTNLVRHGDENEGNFLVSTVPGNPRVFSVDNGVAFSSRESDRGYRWRWLRINRLPAATVDRLRTLTLDDLTRQLETVAEFAIRDDGLLEPVAPAASIDTGLGIRRAGDRIQLGLTRREIDGVWQRVRELLAQVDSGKLEVF